MTSPISSGVAASMAFGDTRTGTEPGTLAGDCCGASERHSFLRLGRFSGTPSQQSTCFPGLIIQIRPERIRTMNRYFALFAVCITVWGCSDSSDSEPTGPAAPSAAAFNAGSTAEVIVVLDPAHAPGAQRRTGHRRSQWPSSSG